MEIVGKVSDTVTVTLSFDELPLESVMVAVMVWAPSISWLVDSSAPIPAPACRLDVHTMELLISPSSGSLAIPCKRTVVPELKMDPSAGLTMHIWGTLGTLDLTSRVTPSAS